MILSKKTGEVFLKRKLNIF